MLGGTVYCGGGGTPGYTPVGADCEPADEVFVPIVLAGDVAWFELVTRDTYDPGLSLLVVVLGRVEVVSVVGEGLLLVELGFS